MDLHYAMSLQWPLTNKWLPRWPLTACQVDSNVMIRQNYSFMNPEDFHLLRDGPCRIPPSSCIGMIESSPFFELTTNDSTFFTSCMYPDRCYKIPMILLIIRNTRKTHIWRKVCCCFQEQTFERVLYIPMYTEFMSRGRSMVSF